MCLSNSKSSHHNFCGVQDTVFLFSGLHLTLGLKVSEHSFYFCDVVDFYFYLKEMAILDSLCI